jgi:hypothetical protein
MKFPQGLLLLAAGLMATTTLAGCASSDLTPDFDPTADVAPTGNTVHLVMSVIDLYNTSLYPGLKANMWAFCATPFDPADDYSKAAISYYDPLPTDAPLLNDEQRHTCSVPGPTITVAQGDRVIVEFSHSHFHPHTIHWHGQFVDNQDDGVPGMTQQAVASGEHYTYDFIAKRPGTLWYHCHVDTQFHVMEGLYGMFIVKPKDTSHEPKVDAEATMILSTATRDIVEAIGRPHQHPPGCFTSGTPNCQNPPLDTTADVFLINGHSYPYTEQQAQSHYYVDEGKSLRIRVLNAGNTVEELHLHGHDMLVTHKDGLPLTAPYYADTLTIGPAERYDVVVVGHNPGVWAFHTHVNNHEANDQQVPGGMHTVLVDGADSKDHIHGFPAELPGGVPYQPPTYIPQDYRDVQQFRLGDATGTPVPGIGTTPSLPTAASATLTFPVAMPCSVKAIQVDAYLGGASPRLAQLSVDVLDANGGSAGSFPLGRDASNPAADPVSNGRYLKDDPGIDGGVQNVPAGNWTVQVSGDAVASDLTVVVTVDHYGSFDELKFLHKLDKRIAYCGKYGNGTDGLASSAPPT